MGSKFGFKVGRWLGAHERMCVDGWTGGWLAGWPRRPHNHRCPHLLAALAAKKASVGVRIEPPEHKLDDPLVGLSHETALIDVEFVEDPPHRLKEPVFVESRLETLVKLRGRKVVPALLDELRELVPWLVVGWGWVWGGLGVGWGWVGGGGMVRQ